MPPAPSSRAAALKRKGKGEDVQEEHMEAVVRAHNSELLCQGHLAATSSRLPLASCLQQRFNPRQRLPSASSCLAPPFATLSPKRPAHLSP
jgi:hypothetical protein